MFRTVIDILAGVWMGGVLLVLIVGTAGDYFSSATTIEGIINFYLTMAVVFSSPALAWFGYRLFSK